MKHKFLLLTKKEKHKVLLSTKKTRSPQKLVPRTPKIWLVIRAYMLVEQAENGTPKITLH